MLDAVEYILKNKAKIANDAVAWMLDQHPSRTNNPDKCIRDICYILDAYVNDLNSNNSIQTVNVANNFWSNGVRQVKKYKIELKVHVYIVDIIKEHISKESGDKLQLLLDIFCSILINGPVEDKDSISQTLQKYRYVREYDTEYEIDRSVVEKCIQTAWKNTPSKNNFMNYRVTVVGPDRQDLKDAAFDLCLFNECRTDTNIDLKKFWKERYVNRGTLPQFYNVKNCSYLLIFSQRICPVDEMNPWQKYSAKRGRVFEQCDTDPRAASKGAILESGLFASNLGALCLEHDLDISHTLCMPWEGKYWTEFGIENDPIVVFIMTIGKGKVYRRDHVEDKERADMKPDFHKVVNFL